MVGGVSVYNATALCHRTWVHAHYVVQHRSGWCSVGGGASGTEIVAASVSITCVGWGVLVVVVFWSMGCVVGGVLVLFSVKWAVAVCVFAEA